MNNLWPILWFITVSGIVWGVLAGVDGALYLIIVLIFLPYESTVTKEDRKDE